MKVVYKEHILSKLLIAQNHAKSTNQCIDYFIATEEEMQQLDRCFIDVYGELWLQFKDGVMHFGNVPIRPEA